MNRKKIEIKFGQPATFSDMLTIAFIALKLNHSINWSWIWVLAPTWISLIAAFIIILITLTKGRDK